MMNFRLPILAVCAGAIFGGNLISFATPASAAKRTPLGVAGKNVAGSDRANRNKAKVIRGQHTGFMWQGLKTKNKTGKGVR